MPSSIIRSYILKDVVDSTPATIYVLNASGWPSVSDVPTYMYQSLCTIWTGASGDIADFRRGVVANSGQGKLSFDCIELSAYICESSNADGQEGEFIRDDAPGAEDAILRITFKTKTNPAPARFDAIQNAELRVRMLLDANLRQKSGKPPSIPIDNTDDKSIDPSYGLFMLSWLGFETEPSSSQLVSYYAISYIRDFGAGIIP